MKKQRLSNLSRTLVTRLIALSLPLPCKLRSMGAYNLVQSNKNLILSKRRLMRARNIIFRNSRQLHFSKAKIWILLSLWLFKLRCRTCVSRSLTWTTSSSKPKPSSAPPTMTTPSRAPLLRTTISTTHKTTSTTRVSPSSPTSHPRRGSFTCPC